MTTRLDVIRRIGDVLTEIDVAVGSLRPGDPDMLRLQDLRRLLDARQLMIARRSFDEHTPAFQAAVAKLTAAATPREPRWRTWRTWPRCSPASRASSVRSRSSWRSPARIT